MSLIAGRSNPTRTVITRRRLAGAGAVAAGFAFGTRLAGAQGAIPGSTPGAGGNLTIYCGRDEDFVGGLIPRIEAGTGIALDVRYGNTAELATRILEEGDDTPAGLYFGQDAGSLDALAAEGRLTVLPPELIGVVDERFRSSEGLWVGLSGRARVLVHNPEVTDPSTLPTSIVDLPTAELNGPIGWAPTSASFQSFVTALRVSAGDDAARAWLEAMIATEPVAFDGDGPQIRAAADQEIAVGLVDHYHLYRARAEAPDISAENYLFPGEDIGNLVNVAGVGVIAGSGQEERALAVTGYLLGEEAQTYFATETSEYPLATGVEPVAELVPLAEIETPDVDLSDLDDLEGTLTLLTDVGLI